MDHINYQDYFKTNKNKFSRLLFLVENEKFIPDFQNVLKNYMEKYNSHIHLKNNKGRNLLSVTCKKSNISSLETIKYFQFRNN
uniref:Uncharacterized protein n=1 Tax=Moumouvirus sp. 'Monve' TaxID=1128131 RepID=H2EFD6_9VIRU|nr:hypothetical protein mv_R999 [Moumouvirus Monve]